MKVKNFAPGLCCEGIDYIPSSQKVGSLVGVYKAPWCVLIKSISSSLCLLWIITRFCGWHLNSRVVKIHYGVCVFNVLCLIHCCKASWKLIQTEESRMHRAASLFWWPWVMFAALYKPACHKASFNHLTLKSLTQHMHSTLRPLADDLCCIHWRLCHCY